MTAPAILLPGIIQPAALRYAALVRELGDALPGVRALPKELEIYTTRAGPAFGIPDEVRGIDRFADEQGIDRFHLYGHSGGGACALAYVAVHPDRVLTLTVDEPASDFTPACRADPLWDDMRAAMTLPEAAQLGRFLELQLAPEVPVPPPPPGPRPDWFAARPAGVRTMVRAILAHEVDPARFRAFDRPVLFTHGGLSNPFWDRMAVRLVDLFPSFRAERWPNASHLQTSHQIDPPGVARLLRAMWGGR